MTLYRFLLFPLTFSALLFFVAPFHKKLRLGLKLRSQGLPEPLLSTKSPIWIHCSSGEFEYAKPLIQQIKLLSPTQPVMVTYFSTSYAEPIKNFPGVDLSCPLPLDLPGPVTQFLNKYQPKILLIARTDLWPELLYQTHRKKTPIVLFSATRGRIRLKEKIFKPIFIWLYSFVDKIFCVSEQDKNLFYQMTSHPNIQVIGDTRYDQVRERLNQPILLKTHLKPNPQELCLVAGSTWPEDEAVLLPALSPLVREGLLRLILVPHELSQLEGLKNKVTKEGLNYQVYSQAEYWNANQVLIVDQVGILASLYTWGQLAFVGGSFKKSVHSVMEPLAAGSLVFVGPHYRNNREAIEFQNIRRLNIPLVQPIDSSSELHKMVQNYMNLKPLDRPSSELVANEVTQRTGATQKLLKAMNSFFF